MKTKKILQMILEQQHEVDTAKLLTNMFYDTILNQKYLQAIAESQLYIMQKMNPQPDFDVDRELAKLDQRTMEAAEQEILEAIQQIIRKD